MLCQHCKKNQATITCKGEIGGKVFESKLCRSCYLSIYGEFSAKVSSEWAELLDSPVKSYRFCPVCGTTYGDYERTGLLGCPSCYDVFKEELLPDIERVQQKTVHVGKQGGNNDELGLHRQLRSLQEQLEAALREKRFIDAGRLNARISEINRVLYGGGEEDERR